MDSGNSDVVPFTKPMRLIEMVFCVVLIALLIHIGSTIAIFTYLAVMYIAFGGFLIITLTDVISQLTADPIPDTPMFLLSLAGCALFLTAGGLGLDCYFDTDKVILPEDGAKIKRVFTELLVIASLSILNGVIFLVDAALIFRRNSSVTPSDRTTITKLSKKPTSAQVEDRLMAAARGTGRNGGQHGKIRGSSAHQRMRHYSHPYTLSQEEETVTLPGTPQVSEGERYEPTLKVIVREGMFSEVESSPRTQSSRATSYGRISSTGIMILPEGYQLSNPRTGGPNGKRRRRRKCCRILIWQRERIISVFLKVLESALGIACLSIFVREIWLEESPSLISTGVTFTSIVTATTLATTLTINTFARNPAHRTPFFLSAVIGATLYYLSAFLRFYTKDNLSIKMETPVLITGAVSLVDAALCLATFINMESNNATGEQPQRPARRLDKTQKKPDQSPEELKVKKAKKTSFFIRAKKYFKKSEPQ